MKIITDHWRAFLIALLLTACSEGPDPKNGSGVSLHTELGGDATGYERACGPRAFSFPQDHGAHPAFRNEWWYVTGNLEGAAESRYGFHATFFRIANKQTSSAVAAGNEITSQWASDEFYMAHFAIADAASQKVKAHERFARSAAGLAGAEINTGQNKVRVWLDDWQLIAKEHDDRLQWQLQISDGAEAIDLTLVASKPAVLQGKEGYSQKSADPCNSSFYYSSSRLQANGEIQSAGVTHNVTGTAWLDREWSSSALADNQVGWDWFALQLDDGRDIMLYQLRNADGSIDPFSYAVEIDQNGNKTVLPNAAIDIEVDQWWQSESGARYPVSGEIRRSDTNEVIRHQPLINDQELDLTVRYWEGAIVLRDAQDQAIGRGYLELTGY